MPASDAVCKRLLLTVAAVWAAAAHVQMCPPAAPLVALATQTLAHVLEHLASHDRDPIAAATQH